MGHEYDQIVAGFDDQLGDDSPHNPPVDAPTKRITFSESTAWWNHSAVVRFGVVLTILLMVVGVYAIVVARPELIAGAASFGSLILYGLGSAAIVLATTLGRPLLERRLALSSLAGAFVTTALAVGLAVIAGYLAYGRTLVDRTADITILWLVAVALVVTVALAGRLHRSGHATSPHTTTSPRRPAIVAAVAGVLAIAALTRFLSLTQFPSASAHDEWFFILDARGFRDGVLANQFRTYDVVVQSDVWTWVDGLLSRPFPDEPSSYRLLGAITGTLVVVATILLGRRTLGIPTALAGGLIVATFPALLWASRTAMANILDPLILTIALWLTDRVLSTRDRRDALACGIVLGVGYYGYFSARAFPFVVAVCMLGLLFPRPTLRSMLDYVRLGAWTAAGFGVTAAPMLAYAASNPDEFFLRVKAMSDAVVAPAFTDRLRLIIQGLAIPLTIPQGVSIHATTTQVNMLGSVATLFFGIGVVSWLVAATAQMFRRSWTGIAGRPAILLVAWVMLAIPASQTFGMESHRFLAITPLWALATATGILIAARAIGLLLRSDRVLIPITLAILLALVLQNLTYFFDQDRQYDMWGSHEATLAYDLGWRFHTAPKGTEILGAGWDELKFTWAPAFRYWAPDSLDKARYLDRFSTTEPPFGAPTLAPGQVLILGAGRFNEACFIMEANPQAIVGTAFDRYGGPLYIAFANESAFPFRDAESPAESTFMRIAPPTCDGTTSREDPNWPLPPG